MEQVEQALRKQERETASYLLVRPVCVRCREPVWEEKGHYLDGLCYCRDCWRYVNLVYLEQQEDAI